MPTTFERANKVIEAMVQHALEKYHPGLHKEGVTIDTMVARATDKDEMDCHALKRNGYAIDAKIQVTSLVDRARGIADAKLTIDGFDCASDKRKAALIDHELEHLDLVPIKPTKGNGFETGWKRDNLGRPKLRTKPHDWELTGFKDVVERHGENSHEAQQFAAFRDAYGQLNMFGPSVLTIAAPVNGKKHRSIAKGSTAENLDLSTRCARRHHKDCKYAGCQCECHQGARADA